MLKTQRDFDTNVIRSGTRIRESVRSLPKGHFQQIRQMFDKPIYPNKKLSTIYERQSNPFVFRLPVTDDDKFRRHQQHQTLEHQYRDYVSEYQTFRLKVDHEYNQHRSLFPDRNNSSQLLCSPVDNHSFQEVSSYPTSLPLSQFNESFYSSKKTSPKIMSSTVNYSDSYDATPLNRTGSSRKYVSSLQHTLAVHAKPVVVTPLTCNAIKINPTSSQIEDIYSGDEKSRRLHSSTSLSSTGYDSNSSPSMKSNRNSIATTNSHDFLPESACSSSPSTSSIDEQPSHSQSIKPWLQYESNPSIYHDEAFESSTERSSPSTPSHSRTQLNKSVSIEQRPVIMTRQGASQDSSIHESLNTKRPMSNSAFTVQTTTFSEKSPTNREIHRWNNYHAKRIDLPNAPPKRPAKYCVNTPRQSTGFQVSNTINQQERKPSHAHDGLPLPMVENPIYDKIPPKKPPRTFEQKIHCETTTTTTDQKVPSTSSSNSNSPTVDLGARSVSCMDLTGDVSNVMTGKENRLPMKRNSLKSQESVPLNQSENFDSTPKTKSKVNQPSKSNMKKGVSEPNLNKRSRSKSPFSPRGLLDRVRRALPILSASKQSLNHNDSDDSASSISEHNEQRIRISKLDHVCRVKSSYESVDRTKFFLERQSRATISESLNLYDYVVLLQPEQELGCISQGNGCLTSSNILSHLPSTAHSSSSSVIYKYPPDANDEKSLKYFCFPDQYDANNNSILLAKKLAQEYFRFILTNMDGTRQYGYCSRFVHKGKIKAFCLISQYDIREIYEKILLKATELFIAYKEDDARKFFEEIYSHRLPNRGDTIHISTQTVGVYTLKCEFDRRKESIDSLSLLNLSTETIIRIFSAILYEQKLIFIGNELGPLTRLIHTFVCLLYPFTWPHTYVPILPGFLLDVIQAPTPYIVGILRSSEPYLSTNDDLRTQDNSDILIIDIDHDRIRSMNDYLNVNIETSPLQILPKTFIVELKQEISFLRKTRLSLSLDECQERLRDVFMSIFVQSCFNYRDFYHECFYRDRFVQSKQHTIELFLEWFTRTQIFELFIRQKFEYDDQCQWAISFDVACEEYRKTSSKQTPQRMTVKSVKRKSATRANKQN